LRLSNIRGWPSKNEHSTRAARAKRKAVARRRQKLKSFNSARINSRGFQSECARIFAVGHDIPTAAPFQSDLLFPALDDFEHLSIRRQKRFSPKQAVVADMHEPPIGRAQSDVLFGSGCERSKEGKN
jgi:hypothetical protein